MVNSSKRVCIIRSNAVRPDSRVEKEAATLQKNGYKVMILAWDRDSDHNITKENIVVYNQTIDIFRIGCKATFGDGVKNIKPYLKFQFKQFAWLLKNKNRYDFIHACDFDTALFSKIANFFIRKKYIFDIFDFLYGNPKNIIQKLVKKIQIQIINRADATIICTEERKKQIKTSKPRKLVVIHNTPIKNFNVDCSICEMKSKKTKVVYVGILQDYRLLIEMSNFFINNKEIELHIAGFGKYESYFKTLSQKYENIFFYGRVSYEETLALEGKSDIMLAIYDPLIENHIYAAPNKFYESLMLGKPVIMTKGTGMSNYLSEYKFGALIDYSLESFSYGIQYLIENRKNWDEMGKRMNYIYEQEFSWDVMEKRLIEMYDALSKEK